MACRGGSRARMKGFTLIELMIVVAVVAILATIAYPSYQDAVRKARRSDGIEALTSLQLAQQRLRSSCRFFAQNLGAANVCGADAASTTVNALNTSPEGYYTIAIDDGTASTTDYTITATGAGDQVNDDEQGVSCSPLQIVVNAANPNGVRQPPECW